MRHPHPDPENRSPVSHHTPQENEKVRKRKAAVGEDRTHLRHADISWPLMPPLSVTLVLPGLEMK